MSKPTTYSLLAREQFRLYQLQVYNWGTFSGLHTIPIAERGFLFVGRSGSGKSTLLDGIAALLTPPRFIDFNAAAREADRSGRDRNWVTYVRGAWAEQKDDASGEIATRYLRPGSTWSALALTYQNSLNQTVTLVQLFWLRGNSNTNADVRRYFLIFERAFDLREVEHFDLDVRKLKQKFTEAFIIDEFRPYCERFCRLLGLENEMALRLLHKTQSAKNLGDLNIFLRDFMLEKPETFAVADRLVSEFSELNAAYLAVVTAREQIQTLAPAHQAYQQLQALHQEKSRLNELILGLDSYREKNRLHLLTAYIAELAVQAEGLAGEVRRHELLLANQASALRDLEQQHRDLGGGRIEQFEAEKQTLESRRDEHLRKRNQAEAACRQLDWTLGESPQVFAELTGKARTEMENWQKHSQRIHDEQIELSTRKKEIEKEFTDTVKEVNALRSQPSNIPAEMLELRKRVAQAIGLEEAALPFAGELIEVDEQEKIWQGAIERALRGFALSLLVDDRHYTSLANALNNMHLNGRLIYFRISHAEPATARKQITLNSLVKKLNLKEGYYQNWLRRELEQRFDYACVDSLVAFRKEERALTREGQIRHNTSRHEKDDRRAIDDRRYWVLGFDNREKLTLFERQAQTLAETISRLTQEIDNLAKKAQHGAQRAMQCQTLVNLQWQEIDVAPVLNRISAVEQELQQIRLGNQKLQTIGERIKKQRDSLTQAEQAYRDLAVRQQVLMTEIDDKQKKQTALQQNPLLATELTPFQQQGLSERFSQLRQVATLDNLDYLATQIERALHKDLADLEKTANQLEKEIENRFAEFKRQWPMEASDVDARLAAAQDFFAKLQRLQADNLPHFEQRFFDLLQSQSHQNLAALSTHISQARKTIFERLEWVNESLQQAAFNPGTYLHIDASDRQLSEVREFKQAIQQALSYAWSGGRENAEERFLLLQNLVERLANQDAEHQRWRQLVLDVRQHVEFIAREKDAQGREIEIYRSGAGKSGGQRQKLATTCLAAALRYQLGGHERGAPVYAPVVLDEAFDKADNEFTALAMNIFTHFGFQMIVATPLKSVMTLEPFIGGACFVDIRDRRHSSVLLIEYDADKQRLKVPEHEHHDEPVAAIS